MENFEHFLYNCIFFNSSTSEKEKEEVRNLVLETCRRIEAKNPNDILQALGNVEFIIYKPIEGDSVIDVNRSQDGGVTIKCEIEKSEIQKSCWRCFVIYYLKEVNNRETQLFILAHELGHAFYQHPIIKPRPSHSELDEFEHAANEKAIEWGFRPHDDDILKNIHFRKYFGNNPKNDA
jgi:hypothetical protein